MALEIKEWYSEHYDACINQGCRNVKGGARDRVAIRQCLTCWISDVAKQEFLEYSNVNVNDVTDCINKYLYSFLSNELPTLETSSAHKGMVRLPSIRPSDNWWAITVKLPCKPRVFMFWNAYCINSFVDGLGMSDYALTQNNFMTSDEITFYAEFDDTCRFAQDEIEILWSESIPTPALPQISSFPGAFPPNPRESGNIYLNQEALSQLMVADGALPAEFGVAGRKASPKRRKRQLVGDSIVEIGVLFPCTPKSFGLTDKGYGAPPMVGGGRRYSIDTTQLQPIISPRSVMDFNLINFDIEFGYNTTGCMFDSSDVKLVVNPEKGWLDEKFDAKDTSAAVNEAKPAITTTTNSKQTTVVSQINRDVKAGTQVKKASAVLIGPPVFLTCLTCEDEISNEKCAENGTIVTCSIGEVCLTTVRQINRRKALVTKSCKQKLACDNIEAQNAKGQCIPGEISSVCRCCCVTAECNRDYLPCV